MSRRRTIQRSTINDVARLAGVSKATVSRVISGSAPVNAETAVRVQRAIDELNYIPSATAQALSDQRTNAFGLLVGEIAAPYFLYLLRGIESAARDANMGLLIHSVRSGAEDTVAYQPFLGEHNTDGLIIFSGCLPDSELRRLQGVGLPLVLLHRTAPDDLLVSSIAVDNRAGTRLVVDHLISMHGCRRIAFLRGPETEEDSRWRELGYQDALATHGIFYDPVLVGYGGFDERIAYDTVSRWLADGLAFDAIFTGDDEAAPGVLTALREARLRVPEDIAVVGFDDDYVASRLVPALTTVHSPIEQVGRAAVRELFRQMEGHPPRSQVLPVELVVRQSCGCQ